MKRWITGLATLAASSILVASAQASLLSMDLRSWDDQVTRDGEVQVGARGLWLGEDFDYNDSIVDYDNDWKNWIWDNTSLVVENDGDARISGTMTRVMDGSQWGVDIKLFDLELRGEVFEGRGNGAYAGMVDDLLASGDEGSSIEWDDLRMRLDAPYMTSVPTLGWRGYQMPQMGHINAAELRLSDGRLKFDAWYRNPWSFNYHYRVGDSKARAGGTDPVPEPATALLIGLGLAAMGGHRLGRRR